MLVDFNPPHALKKETITFNEKKLTSNQTIATKTESNKKGECLFQKFCFDQGRLQKRAPRPKKNFVKI